MQSDPDDPQNQNASLGVKIEPIEDTAAGAVAIDITPQNGVNSVILAVDLDPSGGISSSVVGLHCELPLARIEIIVLLMGDENRFSIAAPFNVDSDWDDVEISLFNSEVIGKA